ncbi:DUF2203 family protein [Candidatus Uabimicrobium sp. HlEnr_7]|uniref:DUF2203 family protein n=1 Tax=Candidatus Uabimicrobium helgolandensis TaxID=3095367 RepID=UPI003556BF11
MKRKTPKIFTLEEVKNALPYIKSITSDLVSLHQQLLGTTDKKTDRYLRIKRQMQVCREELRSVGCHVKSEKGGLIAFYWKGKSDIAELYWQLGEEDIYYWREISKKNLNFLPSAIKKIEFNVQKLKTPSIK